MGTCWGKEFDFTVFDCSSEFVESVEVGIDVEVVEEV